MAKPDSRVEKQRKFAIGEFNAAVERVKALGPISDEAAAMVVYLHAIAASLIYVGDAVAKGNPTSDAD